MEAAAETAELIWSQGLRWGMRSLKATSSRLLCTVRTSAPRPQPHFSISYICLSVLYILGKCESPTPHFLHLLHLSQYFVHLGKWESPIPHFLHLFQLSESTFSTFWKIASPHPSIFTFLTSVFEAISPNLRNASPRDLEPLGLELDADHPSPFFPPMCLRKKKHPKGIRASLRTLSGDASTVL